MTSRPDDRPPAIAPGCGCLVLRLLAPLLLGCVWLAAPPDARADGCDGCPAPTLQDLQQVPGFKLETRTDWLLRTSLDYYELDRGECEGSIDGVPEVTIEDAWLALRANGEVWNCPHSKSDDTITVESAASDRTDWTFSANLSAGLTALGVALKAELAAGRTTGTTVTEVTRISKTLTPAFCHRIPWKAYFQVAKVKAVGSYQFRQRWAWWTKNELTGSSTVHASGDIYMDCGSGTIELTRHAPISGHFDLEQRGCDEEECAWVVPKQLGMFPPWVPPGTPEGEPGDAPVVESPEVEEDEPPAPEDEAPDGPTSSDELGDAPTGTSPDPLGSTP